MIEENLWNVVEHKTRRVIEHITNRCNPERCKSINGVDFSIRCEDCIITKALEKKTANDMLESIGYEVR